MKYSIVVVSTYELGLAELFPQLDFYISSDLWMDVCVKCQFVIISYDIYKKNSLYLKSLNANICVISDSIQSIESTDSKTRIVYGRFDKGALALALNLHFDDKSPNDKDHSKVVSKKDSIGLVGAGVVNLITALRLSHISNDIHLYDRMPDPRKVDSIPKEQTGATFGGQDARIFSFNESRHHLARGIGREVLQDRLFRKTVSNGGWLSNKTDEMGLDCLRWIEDLEQVPSWRATKFNDEIISINKDSAILWDGIFSRHPELLRNCHFKGSLLRIYQNLNDYAGAIESEKKINAYINNISLTLLHDQEPALTSAINNGSILAALHVKGFSLNIKSFCRNLIDLLESMGVKFHWNTKIEEMSQQRKLYLKSKDHRFFHPVWVISPGAYTKAFEAKLPEFSQIGSMMGMWITLPNKDNPLVTPVKVKRKGFGSREAAEGANIIPGIDDRGNPIISCSSGHGFLGRNPEAVSTKNIEELKKCILETANDLFPEKFEQAKWLGILNYGPEYCIRPWTASGLGILNFNEFPDNTMVVSSGGHNTGGFAQAPAIAEEIARRLSGTKSNVESLYSEHRGKEKYFKEYM